MGHPAAQYVQVDTLTHCVPDPVTPHAGPTHSRLSPHCNFCLVITEVTVIFTYNWGGGKVNAVMSRKCVVTVNA